MSQKVTIFAKSSTISIRTHANESIAIWIVHTCGTILTRTPVLTTFGYSIAFLARVRTKLCNCSCLIVERDDTIRVARRWIVATFQTLILARFANAFVFLERKQSWVCILILKQMKDNVFFFYFYKCCSISTRNSRYCIVSYRMPHLSRSTWGLLRISYSSSLHCWSTRSRQTSIRRSERENLKRSSF